MTKEYSLKLTHYINAGSPDANQHSVEVGSFTQALLVRESLADCMLLFSGNIVSNNFFILEEVCEGEHSVFMDQDGYGFDDYQLVDGKTVLKENGL